ncbi:CvpA family protein [Candidatus Parcubacteria bacterium]|nr:CvpA family protein [Candidatus Parcubacteria bacterium]
MLDTTIGNWMDLLVIFYLFLHLISGMRKGLFSIFVSLISFILALIVAFFTYAYSAVFFIENFGIDNSYANVLGFFTNIFIVKIIIFLVVYKALSGIASTITNSFLNRLAGGLVLFTYGIVIVFLIFSITLSFSLPDFMNKQICSSTTGKFVESDPLKLNDRFKNIFGDVLKTTIEKFDFLTVETGENEKIDLNFKISDLKIDEQMEIDMLEMVNYERTLSGLSILVVDEKAREAARKHGRDMFENGYFSHEDLNGGSHDDRMKETGTEFMMSGENLALSQDLESAHEGLMNSPGHRKNILHPFFHRVGIGVIDGGEYGIIFVQNFAD